MYGTMGFAIRKFPKRLYLGQGRLRTKEASKQCSGSVIFGPPGPRSESIIICMDPDPYINKQKIKINHNFYYFVNSQ
jgi:hypothetical protein